MKMVEDKTCSSHLLLSDRLSEREIDIIEYVEIWTTETKGQPLFAKEHFLLNMKWQQSL